MLRSRRDDDREHGQILVLFSLVLVVILAFAAIVVDLGVLRNNRQILLNTFDSAALAGGTVLPVNGASEATAANALIAQTIQANYPGLPESAYSITYKCLIGVTDAGQPRIADVPLACNPGPSLGWTSSTTTAAKLAAFKGAGPTRVSSCNPTSGSGDTCNVVVITGSATTPFSLGPVVGVPSGSTGTVVSAACGGACGASMLTPVDVVLIIDRTGSMEGVDTDNARSAANALVSFYDPALQWLGLSLLGPSRVQGATPTPTPTSHHDGGGGGGGGGGGTCATTLDSSVTQSNMGAAEVEVSADRQRWVPIGLSGVGSLVDSTFAKVTAGIACYNTGNFTDIADTIAAAQYELQNNGRTGVRKGIILMTDGQPNAKASSGLYTSSLACNNTSLAATAAKAAGIEIFTIAFGLDGDHDPKCDKDTSGDWQGKTAVDLLVSVASKTGDPVTGTPAVDGGCPGTSNTDGDHYFCIPKTTGASTDLSAIFVAAAAQMAKGGAKLLQLYPTPVITGLNPSTGYSIGGNSVTITGKFLTDTIEVRFGGTPATFTPGSDTSLTATAPAGAVGVVDITVTTLGGTTPIVTADRYTYTLKP
jgi:hypothetical protein